MSFSHRIRRRFVRRVALGLAVAAVVAPTAAAVGPAGSHPYGGGWFQKKAFIEARGPVLPAVVVGPGGQLTAKNPVLPAIMVGPDG